MLAKILRWLFPCTISSFEIAAADKRCSKIEADRDRRLHMMWDVYRIGKTKNLYTYRDIFAAGVLSGFAESISDFPADKADCIYDGEPFPWFAYPSWVKNEKKRDESRKTKAEQTGKAVSAARDEDMGRRCSV